MKVRVEKQIGASVLSIETGYLAKQAAGSCLVQYGETVVLVAAATGPPRPGIDFFPLTCDYRERTAAAGKFPGGFLKREGRPTMKETLTSRLVDRPIRPLFPEWFHDEVQVQSFVLASDRQNDADVLAMNGASACLGLSPLPFEGPVAAVRLGRIDGRWVPFPTQDDLEESDLDLIVSGSKQAVLMIEGFAREMPENVMFEAIAEAHRIIIDICDLQEELFRKANVEKKQYQIAPPDGVYEKLKAAYYAAFKAAKQTTGKHARADAVAALKVRALAELIPDPAAAGAIPAASLERAWHKLEEQVVRDLILSGTRPDGRGAKDLRHIECQVDVLPRVHGSAVFQRGETQALITVTLGTTRDEQRVDGLIEEYTKKFMLDYNFPSFSRRRSPADSRTWSTRNRSRRTWQNEASSRSCLIRSSIPLHECAIISDILGVEWFQLDGFSVCGATLGLMAAGVPITNPVAGISIGLVKETDGKLDAADRHHRRRGPFRRHGFQDRRHAERYHGHPTRSENRRHQRRHHSRHDGPVARGADPNSAHHADRHPHAPRRNLVVGAAPAAHEDSAR